jgi:hypothetical protein
MAVAAAQADCRTRDHTADFVAGRGLIAQVGDTNPALRHLVAELYADAYDRLVAGWTLDAILAHLDERAA